MPKVKNHKKPFIVEHSHTVSKDDLREWEKSFYFEGWRKWSNYKTERGAKDAVKALSRNYAIAGYEFRVKPACLLSLYARRVVG